MPPSIVPRRSSIPGVRRGPQKAHIPYHADDLGRGKKTGYSIEPIEHASDDFEDFAKVLKQADARTPPRVKSKAKKSAGKSGGRSGKKKTPARPVVQSDEEEEGGGGEQDMSIEVPASPMEYFRNARPRAPQSRPSIIPRLSSRGSEVDFDQIPSPRPSHSGRRSLAGPSYLSQGSAYEENDESLDLNYFQRKDEVISRRSSGRSAWEPPEPDADIDMNQDMDYPMDEDQPLQEDGQDESPRATPSPPPPSASHKSKSKSRVLTPAPEEDEDAPMDPPEDEPPQEDEPPPEEEIEPPPSPPKKKAKAAKKENKRLTTRETVEPAEDQENRDANGLRRGTRYRYAPLAHWRNEKVVYGRSGALAEIKKVIRYEPDPVESLGKKKRKRTAKPRSKGRSESRDLHSSEPAAVLNPEEGWDDETEPQGTVLEYPTNEEVRRRIIWTAKMVNPKPTANGEWSFEKVFGDGDFIAAGLLTIPPKCHKASKNSKDNTYIFYVIQGAVNLRLNTNSAIIATGGMFLVPRGNMYFLENVCDREVKLFFTQARKVMVDRQIVDGEEVEVEVEVDEDGQEVVDEVRSSSGPVNNRASASLVKKEKEKAKGAKGSR